MDAMATPILILAANAPDVDIVSAAGGSLNYLHFHRHLTHSLIAMPLMAILSVVLVRLIGRKPVRWLGAWAIAMVAVASHLLLDLTNTYGVRLLLPFSARWLRLDITNVVDVWIWSALFLASPRRFWRAWWAPRSPPGRAKPAHHGRGAAWCALAFLLLYNCGRFVLHARAVAIAESRIYQGAAPLRVACLPNATNPVALARDRRDERFLCVSATSNSAPSTTHARRRLPQARPRSRNRRRTARPHVHRVPALFAIPALARFARAGAGECQNRRGHRHALRDAAGARLYDGRNRQLPVAGPSDLLPLRAAQTEVRRHHSGVAVSCP